jgi:hypothetical protein
MTGYERSDPYSSLDCGGFGAEFVEGGFEIGGNGRSFAGFDVAARHHVDELTVAEDCNRGRGRGLAGEITAGAFGGLRVLSREYGEGMVGVNGILQRHADSGAHAAGGASADRIYNHQSCSLLGFQSLINVFCGA